MKNQYFKKDMELEDFLPRYPNIQKDPNNIFNPYNNEEFRNVISSKKEFLDLKLPQVETLPDSPGKLFNHQKMISRFLSSNTPYNELLLYHEMGTGKTCTAIACIEQLREETNHIKGAYVFARGIGLLRNFVDELLFKCTGGQYIPDNFSSLKPGEKAHRIRKKTGEFYTFETFERFAKYLKDLTDGQIRTKFSNIVVVIDEVHNIRLTEKSEEELDIYDQFNRFLHIIENRKILLMSGTPIKDQPVEIANVMNLILPNELQFDPQNFTREYFGTDGTTFEPGKEGEFVRRVSGRISYLKSMTSNVKKVFKGNTMGKLNHFKVWATHMSNFQGDVYQLALEKDRTEKSIHANSRQASLFVFPDGTYGKKGSDKYIVTRTTTSLKNTPKTLYSLSPELANAIAHNVENLRKYSCKYADLMTILENGGKTFVYCEYVDGSGAVLLGLILQQFGFSLATGRENQPGKRYSLVTNKTSTPREIKKTIDQFNSDANRDGAIVSVIIGSRVISEGYSLKGVRTEVILTPHWNYSETAQAIARGWRVGSHSDTPGVTELTVYQTVAIPANGDSIDLTMYELSEKKDMQIKAIEHAIKISAFDCYLNRDRNYITGYDGMRECDYTSCEYKCLAEPYAEQDVVTFDAFYAKDDELVVTFLRDHFLHNFSVTLEELEQHFPQHTRVQLIKTIRKNVESNTLFMDGRHIPQYLRMDRNVIFISMDPSRDADYYTSFYTQDVTVDTNTTFSEITQAEIAKDITTKTQQIFKYPKYVNVIIPVLPPSVQLMLLKGSIEAEDKQLSVNVLQREAVMSYFKGSYIEDDNQWIVTLSVTPVCLQKGGSVWSDCPPESIPTTNPQLLTSEIGYYGMINPLLGNVFCIREVQSVLATDLRKLKVGKKCIDYSKNVLVDIVARRMKKNPPADYLRNVSRDNLKKSLRAIPQTFVDQNDYFDGDEAIKRILFWQSKSREDMCNEIRQWMNDNNYIEVNRNCGLQRKKRALTTVS